MVNENNLSEHDVFDETKIRQKLLEGLEKATKLIEKKYAAGAFIFPSELVNTASIENPKIRENVKKLWKEVRSNPSNLNEVTKGHTHSKNFEINTAFIVFQGTDPITQKPLTLDSQRLLTYVLKPNTSASEALNELLHKSKMLIDCQTAVTIAFHYALYYFLTETFKDEGKSFDALFSEGHRKLVLSKYGVTYDSSDDQLLRAPFTLISYFLTSYLFNGKDKELEAGDYVFFFNTEHYLKKHPELNDQGAAGVYIPNKSKALFFSFGLGYKTKEEILKHFLISYNKPGKSNKSTHDYPANIEMKDIPGLRAGTTFYRFDVEKIKHLCEQIRNGNFPQYLKELDEWVLMQIQSVEEKRYPLICKKMKWPMPGTSIENVVKHTFLKPPTPISSEAESQGQAQEQKVEDLKQDDLGIKKINDL